MTAPVAVSSAIVISRVTQPGPVSGRLTGYDPDVEAVTFALASGGGPKHGTMTISANGSYTYNPLAGYLGTDSFTFAVTDAGGGTSTAVVQISVAQEGPASITGTEGGDVLIGGALDNTIYGDAEWYGDPSVRSGDDQIYGGDGDDSLSGGGGNDTLYGGNGNDDLRSNDVVGTALLFGDAGNDSLYIENGTASGGDGDDQLTSEVDGGSVILLGGAGNDSITLYSYYESSAQGPLGIAYGEAGDDEIYVDNGVAYGGDGNDQLTGREGSIFGDAGDDVLNQYGGDAHGGPDYEAYAYGGDGNDLLSGLGYESTGFLYGDAGNDVLNASDHGTAYGGIGNDTLTGYIAARLYGGDGDDTFYTGNEGASAHGGAGNDTMYIDGTYFGGTDYLFGDDGDDQIIFMAHTFIEDLNGGAGNDTIDMRLGGGGAHGDAGNDTLLGGYEAELFGGTGDDVLVTTSSGIAYGEADNDTLTGGAGNDMLFGGDGVDSLYGGAGNDTLDGGAGADRLEGGTGDDTYVLAVATGEVIVEAAGGGIDQINAGFTITLGAEVENLLLTGTSAIKGSGNALANRLTGNAGANVLTGHDGDDSLYGGAGNDSLDGSAGSDRLEGGAGDDTYTLATAGDVVVEAVGGGTDHVKAGFTYTLGAEVENLTLTGSAALGGTGNALANIITGNAAANSLAGGAGNDTLSGGAGNDMLDGGVGTDRLVGGTGDDAYMVDATTDVVVEAASGGTDHVSANVNVTLSTEVENLTLTGSGALSGTGNVLANRITGNLGANALTGDAGNDTLSGDAGNDSLYGGAGNDTLDGGTGTDRLEGGAGDDAYVLAATGDVVVEASGGGTDQVSAAFTYTLGTDVENLVLTGTSAIKGTGNALANRITGNAAANTLAGGDGNDTLLGGAGNDLLDGGSGADRLEGGTGDDVYVVALAGDVVVETAGGGTDQVSAYLTWTLSSEVETLLLLGTTAINGTGNGLANGVTGNAAANVLSGLDGNDTLLAGAGNDTLDGGAGTDRLEGGTGNDTLIGAAGIDQLTGGTGNDAFQFVSAAEGGDVISDFRNVTGDNDLFRIGAAGFGGGLSAGAALSASRFQVRADNLAQDADDRFIFRTTDKSLWFDNNGNVTGGLTMLADLDAAATMTSADILLV